MLDVARRPPPFLPEVVTARRGTVEVFGCQELKCTGTYGPTPLSNNLRVRIKDTGGDKEFEWTDLLLHLTRATRYNLPPPRAGNLW